MDVIGQHFQRQHFKLVLVSYGIQKLVEAFGNLPSQNDFSVTRYPNEVVGNLVDRVWRSPYSTFFHRWHWSLKGRRIHPPAKAGGFLHQIV